MENKLLLIGNGGHCKAVIDSIIDRNDYDEIGIISKEKDNFVVHGVKCVGCDDELESLFNKGWKNAFISIGSIGDTSIRERLYNKIIGIGFNIPNIIDITAIVSKKAKLGKGIYIGKGTVINIDTTIDDCAIINTGSILEHECKIGKYVHISSNATVCGNSTINDRAHIGAGSVIKQGITIGENSLIGMGSIVTKDISDNVIAYGNPCKEIKKK